MSTAMILLLSLLLAILLAALMLGRVFYRNMHYDRFTGAFLQRAAMVEKQVCLPDGSVLNYGEGPDNGPPLLLIHGQMVTWEDYAPVLPALTKRFHVYAVDCYGHGESSYLPNLYTITAIGGALRWFLEHVIQAKAYVSGLSSGGILAAWLAAYAQEHHLGAVLEDPPMFSTEAERCPDAFAWVDGFQTIHRFLQQTAETNYTRYYLGHSAMARVVGKPWDKMKVAALRYLQKHPGKPLRLFFLPPAVNKMFDLISGPYDLRFGDTFYDCSWFDGLDREQMLASIQVPTTIIHTNWSYFEGHILMAAMNAEDAQRLQNLIPNSKLLKVDSGHDFHQEKPRDFEAILFSLLD